jgi:formate/nitrite transporter FocA (FNT family)
MKAIVPRWCMKSKPKKSINRTFLHTIFNISESKRVTHKWTFRRSNESMKLSREYCWWTFVLIVTLGNRVGTGVGQRLILFYW